MENSFIIGVSGTIIMVLLAVIGFFVSRLIGDVRTNTSEIGKNKGRIDLIAKQQENDIKRIEERTNLEIQNLARSVHELSDNVNTLVQALATKGIN